MLIDPILSNISLEKDQEISERLHQCRRAPLGVVSHQQNRSCGRISINLALVRSIFGQLVVVLFLSNSIDLVP